MNRVSRRDVLTAAAVTGAAVAGLVPRFAAARQGYMLEVPARPGPVSVDTAAAAVLVVDMQNDFGAEGGMFHRAGVDIAGIRAAIAPTARTLAAARGAGLPIFYLKMAYRADLADLGPPGSPNRERHLAMGVGQAVRSPDGRESRVLVRDTWNTDIVAGLEPASGDTVIYKTRFSGFFGTDLHERLTAAGAKHLIVTGCTTSICVESTVRDAMFRDYSCVLLEDCMAEPIGAGFARRNHDASLLSVEALLGWVSSSDAFVRATEGAKQSARYG